MDIEYVDILTRENLSSIWVANLDLIKWSERSSISSGEEEEKGWLGVSLY